MKLFMPFLIALLLCGCSKPEHVAPAEFKKQYAWVGQAQTMHDISYLGQRDGRAFIRVRSMSTYDSEKWSDRVIYVELVELEPVFRESLPKLEMKDK